MKFCSECGKQIDNDARFCPHCGATQTEDTSAVPSEPAVPNVESAFSSSPDAVSPVSPPAPRRNNMLPWLIGCGGVLVALIIAGIIVGIILIGRYADKTNETVNNSEATSLVTATPTALPTSEISEQTTVEPTIEPTPTPAPTATPQPTPDAAAGTTVVTPGVDAAILVSTDWISYMSDIDDYLIFYGDGSFELYTVADDTDQTYGTYQLDEVNQTITLISDEYTRTYGYLLNDSVLILCDDADNFMIYEAYVI